MSRPYMNFRIEQLEAEFERARSARDTPATRHMAAELKAHRKATPRVTRLLRRVERELSYATMGGAASPSSPRRPSSGLGPRGMAPSFSPTSEQEEAVSLFKTGEPLKINAYAGTGKTSTLQLIAHSTDDQGQYLAFNRNIVKDARDKFPPNVNCSTTHSIAWRSLAGRYRREKLNRAINANQLSENLGLKYWRIDDNYALQDRSQAALMLATIRRFCQSDAPEILPEHVPRHGSLAAAPETVLHAVAEATVKGAQHTWLRMMAVDDPLPLGHDGYLKVWALSEPQFQADYVLMDEAQDTNPVVLGVLRKQSAQIVYVGDKYQQIYEWRGAVNAMEEVPAAYETYLTTSFRFGGEVAWGANQTLKMLGEARPLRGNPAKDSRITKVSNGTVLARTNATTITVCIEALDANKKPHLVGGIDQLIAMLRGVQELKQEQPSTVPEFFGFENWNQVLEFVRSGEGEELETFVNLVETRGENQLLWALNRVVDENECDMIISTAHKAKGREWQRVQLMDDFLKSLPRRCKDGKPASGVDPSELRLLYVALTRAQDALEIPSAMHDFLSSGALPQDTAVQPPYSRQNRLRPQLPPELPAQPSPPAWAPPIDWQPPTDPETTGVGREPQTASSLSQPPPLPPSQVEIQSIAEATTKKKKSGLFGWLLGR